MDGLLLPARWTVGGWLMLTDGHDSFVLEVAEAAYYEILVANPADRERALARYYWLRPAGESGPTDLISEKSMVAS